MIEKLKRKIAIKYVCEQDGIMLCNGVGIISTDKENLGINIVILIKTLLKTNILTKQQINRLFKLASTMSLEEFSEQEMDAVKEIVGGK